MNFFGRKSVTKSRSSRPAAHGDAHPQSVSHRLTLDLARSQAFASMLANSRASLVIEVSDMLAGMYICNWDRLSLYWRDEDREEVEHFLRGICRISPQRWHSWIEYYDSLRHTGESWRAWRAPSRSTKLPPHDHPLRPSADLAALFKHAEQIAPSRDSLEGRAIPILTSECVLLCILRTFGSELSSKLAATGIDASKLEREALFPRRGPMK
jgi:hypothetical protein